jgi:hypothetical protein
MKLISRFQELTSGSMVFSSHTNDARSTLAEIEELLCARNNDCGAWAEYQL